MIGPFIFLDIDGVLNHHKPHENGYNSLCPDCVGHFNTILETMKAQVIVTSAWRYFILRGEMTLAGLQGLLCTHGLKWGTIAGHVGPDLSPFAFHPSKKATRAQLIADWFEQNYGLNHEVAYVVLDDMDLGYSNFPAMWDQTVIIEDGMCNRLMSDPEIVGKLRKKVRLAF